MKKSFKIANHATLLICGALLIVLVYGFFRMVMSFADTTTEHDGFENVCIAVDGISQDIAVLSEYEIGLRDPEDMQKRDIPKEGELQETRDRVFAEVQSGFTYISGSDGECGAYYHINTHQYWDYVVRYEKGTAARWLDDSEYCYLIGDSICVTRQQ